MQVNGAGPADIAAVLTQMRALKSQAQGGALKIEQGIVPAEVQSAKGIAQSDFGLQLKSALDQVNHLQKTSSATANDFMAGKHNDLVKVMVDSQKSTLGFQALMQTRNRVVSAYQDIMNMPI